MRAPIVNRYRLPAARQIPIFQGPHGFPFGIGRIIMACKVEKSVYHVSRSFLLEARLEFRGPLSGHVQVYIDLSLQRLSAPRQDKGQNVRSVIVVEELPVHTMDLISPRQDDTHVRERYSLALQNALSQTPDLPCGEITAGT